MLRHLTRSALLAAALLLAGCPSVPKDSAPSSSTPATSSARAPQRPALKADKLAAIDAAINEAIAAKKTPGAIVWVERDGEVYRKTYGHRALVPAVEPITEDTIYDVASLTKVVATTTAVMQLVERGKLDLDAPVARYLPAFAQNDKGAVTLRHLMTHMSGLRSGISSVTTWQGYDGGIATACAEKLANPIGSTFVYSDVNYLVLGELVRLASGKTLDAYARENIFVPLKLNDTGFLPHASLLPRIAPTQYQGGKTGPMLRGVVHDPTSQRMGGIAGSAGLFSTAADLARFVRMIINGGSLDGVRILSAASVAEMTRVQTDGNNRRGLGWDIDSSYSAPRGRWFPAGASFGHTGWTGPSIWIDPAEKAFVLFLGNRVHPDGSGDVIPLRREVGRLAAEAMGLDTHAVLNGIDVLVREDFARLRGKRVGLITNQSGRDRQNRLTIDLLFEAKDVKLVALFSPEHGIRGVADDKVGDTIDEKTKLPVYSLYGESPKRAAGQSQADYNQAIIRSRAPKAEHLAQIDVLIFDIQDVGARFYTYSATLGAAVEAAGKAKKKIMVLDRVNPITGLQPEGPILSRPPSFIAFHEIPVRHGMTLGELAVLFNNERKFGADLEIVKIENWTRDTWLDATGLPWTNPSPSMKSLTAATLYPGFCLLESTSVSMGRGTAKPFEQVGAPYIDGVKLAAELNKAGIPGVRFEPVKFTPSMTYYSGPATSLKYKDKECGGVRAILTDRDRCPVVDIGIELALAVRRLYPNDFKSEQMGNLLGDDVTLNAIAAGETRQQIKARWADGLAKFEQRRKAALLYGTGKRGGTVAD